MTNDKSNLPADHDEVVIPNRTVDNLLNDLTFTNGPGVHFILIGVMEGKQVAVASTLEPEASDTLLDWMRERRMERQIRAHDMEADSFKKGH